METFHRFTLIEGQWFHVVVSWDPGKNAMHASVNGSKNVMQGRPNNHQVIVQSLFSFYDIGFAQPRGAMTGHLRDLTIIGKVLNEEELQNIKVQGKNVSNLVNQAQVSFLQVN